MRKTLIFSLLLCAGCESARLPVEAGIGPNPTLPPPNHTLIPTVSIATAIGWPAGVTPTPAAGLAVNALATGLDHPRWLYVLPNGDVLVAETNAPPRPKEGKGIRGWFFKRFAKRAGSATPSANRITLLRDANGDGLAETRTVFLQNLNSPFGMTLVGSNFYVANSDAVMRFPYSAGATQITSAGAKVVDLPAGERNHHWTKNVIASRDGSRLYVTVGSNSNAGENGLDEEVGRAAIMEVDPANGSSRIYASGLRNPVGLAWQGDTLWVVVNERDEMGSDLVPDYMTSVKDGGFYGWPFSYYGQHVDERVKEQRPGLAFSQRGAFVGQHGSWNRKPRAGYKVIFVPFVDGRPNGMPQDVLTGFLDADGNARGRPVGVAVDRFGALLVADDVGNVIWRVTPKTQLPD
jgi:glucose/arabinose dehydrogenase